MTPDTSARAVAPVVGVALLIAITVILAAVIGTYALGAGLGSSDAPAVTVSFSVTNGEVVVTHERGDRLVAAETVVLDQDGETVGGLDEDLTAGESATVVEDITGIDRIQLVWQDPDSDTESILETFKL